MGSSWAHCAGRPCSLHSQARKAVSNKRNVESRRGGRRATAAPTERRQRRSGGELLGACAAGNVIRSALRQLRELAQTSRRDLGKAGRNGAWRTPAAAWPLPWRSLGLAITCRSLVDSNWAQLWLAHAGSMRVQQRSLQPPIASF